MDDVKVMVLYRPYTRNEAKQNSFQALAFRYEENKAAEG